MHIQFAELPVYDQSRAKAFYIEHFRCEAVADVPMGQDGWRWIELRFPGAETTLHFLPRQDDAPSKQPVLVLVDDEVVATTASLASGGVAIVTPPGKAPYDPERTIAEFQDSEGNRILISSR